MNQISKRITLLVLSVAVASTVAAAQNSSTSPENQVFQFMATGSFDFGGGTNRTATAYLWIPPACGRVRGVLVAGRNVPEHGLVGHSAIREACADSDLAILWCCPTFLEKIPPRTQFPVTVTVAAWQWGRGVEPKVKTAEIVKQTFQITS